MLGRAFEAGLPLLDGGARDALVNRLVDDWHARVAGVGAFLLGFLSDMAASVATPLIKMRRGPLSEGANPAAGDILRYQSRGEPICAYIRKSIVDLDNDVYVLAHSLGGIACVDLLGSESLPRVKGLITVGSQAPYLHEIGALWGLAPGTTELPSHFPPWLNLYDPYDFLSYVAAPVFRRGVRDVRIEFRTTLSVFPQRVLDECANVECRASLCRMIDPLQTHVFAVGIGSYQLGDQWRLPNAAEHALAFVAWARASQVPRDHIHLFLSAPDRERLAAKIAEADVSAQAADYTTITSFVTHVLAVAGGELLYMFWTGHGSVSEEGARVLFFEDLTLKNTQHFDVNDFLLGLRTTSFERFGTQIAFIDACANRFEELGFDLSLGRASAGKGRYSHPGVSQSFFFAADLGEQALEGAFGAVVINALRDATARGDEWPPDQDGIVNVVRPHFTEGTQRPVQLVWTTAKGDVHGIEGVSGDLPASHSVNAAAFSRKLPVRALRRLADIAMQYGKLGVAGDEGIAQRDALYAALRSHVCGGRAALPHSSPRIEMLYIVGAALQWNREGELTRELGDIAPAAEFDIEIKRLAMIREVRELIEELPATTAELLDEYLKTVRRLSSEFEPRAREHDGCNARRAVPDLGRAGTTAAGMGIPTAPR